MKLPKYLFYFLLSIAAISCSDDDDNNDSQESISNHFPLTVGNSWTYNNETSYQDGNVSNSQETITVESTTEEQGVTYYNLDSDASINEQGFFTGILTAGSLIVADNQLIYNGELSVDLANFGFASENISIPLENIIVFDADADSGQILTDTDDTMIQTVDFPQFGTISLSIDYNLSTIQREFVNSFTAGDENFQDVLSSDIIVNIEIAIEQFPITLTILESQDAIQITNYFANDIGLIKSETSINYNFEEIGLPNLPEIPDYSIEYTQEIDSYIINE